MKKYIVLLLIGLILYPAQTKAAITIEYTDAILTESDASEYTFTGVDFGTADTDRYILVGTQGRAAGLKTLTSVTIGGVSATILVNDSNGAGDNTRRGSFAIAQVPTGATGNVVVTYSGTMLRAGIGVWKVMGIDPTAYDTSSSASNNPSATSFNVPALGAAFGFGVTGGGPSATWTGLTEAFELTAAGDHSMTGASDEFVSAQTPLSTGISWTSNDDGIAVWVSFGEAEEAVLGCTDPEAENYDPEATEDDDSCTYSEPLPTVSQTGMHVETYTSVIYTLSVAMAFWFGMATISHLRQKKFRPGGR